MGQEPKRERGHIRVAAILEAGVELFCEKGYDGTTMSEIASRSGTATASLYRFFPTKQAVAEALLLRYAKHALGGLDDLALGATEMTIPKLAAAFVGFAVTLQAERRFAIDLADVGGASEEKRQEFRDAMLQRLGTILEQAIPHLPAHRSQAMAAVLMSVFKAVGGIREQNPAPRRRIVAETERMLCLYLAAARDGT